MLITEHVPLKDVFLEFGDVLVHRTRRYVFRCGDVIDLLSFEFDLLVALILNQHKILTPAALYRAAGGRSRDIVKESPVKYPPTP